MLFLVADRKIDPKAFNGNSTEVIEAMTRSLEWVQSTQASGQILAHYALKDQHRAITIFDVEGHDDITQLIEEWPRLTDNPRIHQLVEMEDMLAFVERMNSN